MNLDRFSDIRLMYRNQFHFHIQIPTVRKSKDIIYNNKNIKNPDNKSNKSL